MTTLIEKSILNERLEKSRSGIYQDTSKNRRLHRVGQKYGEGKKEEEEGEKEPKKEVEPSKELEAVNKVIAAINEGKMTLPPDQIMVLLEKKNKLELSKKEAKEKKVSSKESSDKGASLTKEKLDSSGDGSEIEITNIQSGNTVIFFTKKYGKWYSDNVITRKEAEVSSEKVIRSVESHGNEKIYQIKVKLADSKRDESSKENKAEKSASKKYDKMSIEEAKKELLGKELSIADNETGKTRIEKITSIVEGNVRGHSTVMARVEGGGTYPIKHIGTGKEWKAWKLDIVSGGKKEDKTPEQKSSSTGLSLDSVKEPVQTTDKEEGWKAKINKEDIGKVVGKDNFGNELKIGDRLYRSEYLRGGKWGSSIVRISRKDGNDIKVVGEDIPMEFSYRSGDKIMTEENGKSYVNIQLDGKKYKLEMDERDRSVTDPDTGKRYHAIDDFYDELFENKRKSEKESKKKETPKSEDTQKETYTRVKFDDLPNSGKVNLKKYLSEKVRQGVDEKWSNIKNIPTDNLKKMEKGLVNDLNKNFEAIKKSQRAELLYSIMKVKGELEKRGKESQKKE